MSRTLSPAFKAALLASRVDEDAVALVTVAHANLPSPLRASSHPTDCFAVDPLRYGTRSRGVTFDYIEFQMTLPEDADGKPPAFEIRLNNIGRELIALLQSASDPATVTIEIVSRTNPDLVEIEFPEFDLVSAEYDDEIVTLGLAIDALATEPYPADSFTPAGFRGLF